MNPPLTKKSALKTYLESGKAAKPKFLTYLAERTEAVSVLDVAKDLDLNAARLGELLSIYTKTNAIELAGDGFGQTVRITDVGRELAKVE